MENNILITSVGRRTSLIEYFVQEFKGHGEVHVTDCSSYAPALYMGDVNHIVPRIDDPEYIDRILEICKVNKIKGILSLIDPELSLLGANAQRLLDENVTLFGSPYEVSMRWFDKYESYTYCRDRGILMPKTYKDIDDTLNALRNNEISYPVVVKPRFGSASMDIHVAHQEDDLVRLTEKDTEQVYQEFISGKEYGVDAYVDMISRETVDVFVKEKISMRSGETDKAVSLLNESIQNLIRTLLSGSGVSGPCDVDVLEQNGKYYVLEVNPRFGGGYPLAFECGCNFPRYILNNLQGTTNKPSEVTYEEGVVMMKHDRLLLIRGDNNE